uniref:Uncharacterized protein n=1 Tax=Aegilops tauschii subsp. strangulata TaxID=200361 RepID=A0A452ZKA7_AEGTS
LAPNRSRHSVRARKRPVVLRDRPSPPLRAVADASAV